jgi:ABC-2 type transport system permease protein
MINKLFKKWKSWLDFTLVLTVREIKGRYKHVALGFLWLVANPLLQMVVIGLILQFFPGIRTENYFLYLFLGLLPWNFFAISFSKAVTLYVDERQLIKKAVFPRESLIFSLILSNLFHLLVGFLLVFPFSLISINFFTLVGAMVWIFVFTTCISLFFSSLNVKFRDMSFFVRAMIPIWFYVTPIIYSIQAIPEKIQILLFLNPLTAIIHFFRISFGIQESVITEAGFLLSVLVTVAITSLGVLVFRREQKYFDDWM